MAIFINVCVCRHPSIVPIGQTFVQKARPDFQAHRRIRNKVRIPDITPTVRDIPILPHVDMVFSGCTADATFRIIFHGSKINPTASTPAAMERRYAKRIM